MDGSKDNMNQNSKLTLLIILWALDKLIILLMFIFFD